MNFKRRIENDLVLDSVGTTHTRFFKGPGYLSLLEQHLFPEWEAEVASGSRVRRIRIWTSCSVDRDGPYSLAMSLLERFPATSGWRIQILANGLSTPGGDGSGATQPEITPAESKAVSDIEVHRVNLNDDVYPMGGPFDLILCSSVLTCFTYQSKLGAGRRALSRLATAKHRSKTRIR